MSALGLLLALTLLDGPGPSREFRAEMGRHLKAGATWGVLVRTDLPATLVEIVDGDWRIAEGAPTHETTLPRGALVKVEAVRFDGIAVELQVALAEGAGAALLRFRLPYEDGQVLGKSDAPAARRYIERFVRLFAEEERAREFAAARDK